MNDLRHTVEDAMSLPSTHHTDPGIEIGPSADGPGVDIEALEYYRRLHGRHTLWARIALLTVIVGMLGANMWLTQRNYHAVIVNMDQARLAQAELMDNQAAMVVQQAQHVATLETRMAAFEEAQAHTQAQTDSLVASTR